MKRKEWMRPIKRKTNRKEGLRGMIVKLNKDLGLMCLP